MILIIDDEFALQEVVAEIIELAGVSTISAANGEDGLILFHKYHDEIRAVFLDLHLPGMGGKATLLSLRELNPKLNIVIMSGQPEAVAMTEFSEQKHLSYLEKPFTLDVLMATVDTVLTAPM